MSRWHKQDCSSPDVYIRNDNIPKCRACQRICPPAYGLVSDTNSASSGIKLPPDEPYGGLNLRWPKDVPYINQEREEDNCTQPIHSPSELLDKAVLKLSIDKQQSADSHVYTTLKSEEFRLACLTAVPTDEYPMHLSLETYTYDNRPEYETVSYMWGGENGDSIPCQPIYIGPYWDVLWQSQNCWAMLRFARPRRGIRMIWVDALCINQDDLEERAVQVSRMRQIYGDSERVIVFLGEDIIKNTPEFPTYRDLDDINLCPSYGNLIPSTTPRNSISTVSGPQMQLGVVDNLTKLLQRAYFSRVWMIQELIASNRAVIRVGNVDFRAEAGIIYRLSRQRGGTFSWSRTRAPWLQYLGQKMVSPTRARDIVSLAALTSRCRASDPRDRIFAIGQLLSDVKLRESLAADYTLSFRHVAIGFFAHALLVAGKSFFLDHAGSLYSTHTPSWVPECRSDKAWERALMNAIPRDIDVTPYTAIDTVDCQVYLDDTSVITVREMITVYDYHPAYAKPAIDSATGALSMDLTHLFRFEHKPKILQTHGNLYLYEVITRTYREPSTRLCFFAWTKLDIQVGDHLFTFPLKEKIEDHIKYGERARVAVPQDDKFDPRGLMYLVLRPVASQQGLPTYQLVTTRLGLCASYPDALQRHATPIPFNDSDWPALRNLCFLRLSEVQTDVEATILSILNLLVEATNVCLSQEHLSRIKQLPVKPDTGRNQYAADICEAFYKDCLERPWITKLGRLSAVLIRARSFDKRVVERDNLMVDTMREFLTRNNLKMLLDALIEAFEPHMSLRRVIYMIRDGPTVEQKGVGVPKYVNGVKVDGQIMRVVIV